MSSNLKPPVAANLRFFKQQRGVTWQAIAQHLGAGERLVSAWANEEESDPSWHNLCRLAAFLHVEPWLFYVPHEMVKGLSLEVGETERLDELTR